MQNIVNQWEIIRSQITWFAHRYLYCSGNWTANVLVTETAQYSALHCFFNFKQNDEYLLISNTLRFICSILLAIAFYFILHCARHTAATVVFLANRVSMENVAKILGHANLNMTRHYAKVLDQSILNDMENVERSFRQWKKGHKKELFTSYSFLWF